MTEIFFSPNNNYKKELTFFNYLMQEHKNLFYRQEKKVLPEKLLHKFLNTGEIIHALQNDSFLPRKAKAYCLDVLHQLPNEIAVLKDISKISVDFTIQKGNKVFYIEFHEKQHRTLSKKEQYSIYTTSFEEIKVPRFVQRFTKDIWRYKYLDNYQIIWWDWFEKNPSKKINLFSLGKTELYIESKFSFSNFLK